MYLVITLHSPLIYSWRKCLSAQHGQVYNHSTLLLRAALEAVSHMSAWRTISALVNPSGHGTTQPDTPFYTSKLWSLWLLSYHFYYLLISSNSSIITVINVMPSVTMIFMTLIVWYMHPTYVCMSIGSFKQKSQKSFITPLSFFWLPPLKDRRKATYLYITIIYPLYP